MPLVTLMLTPTQVGNLNKGKGIRLPSNKNAAKISAVSVDVSEKDYKKYTKNVLKGKGCIIKGSPMTDDESSEDEMKGGSIFDDIGKSFKKVGSKIESGSKAAFKDVKNLTNRTVRDGKQLTNRTIRDGKQLTNKAIRDGTLFTNKTIRDGTRFTNKTIRDGTRFTNKTIRDGKQLTNQAMYDGKKFAYKTGRELKKAANTYGVDAIEGFKDYVPPEVAQQIASGAATAGVLGLTAMTGMPNPALAQMAGKAAGVGVDSVYNTNFRQRNALKQLGRNYVRGTKEAMMPPPTPVPMQGGRLVKGSPEAKAFMQALRQRRGSVGGKGITPLGGRGMVPL
jgi:hypothetical protein